MKYLNTVIFALFVATFISFADALSSLRSKLPNSEALKERKLELLGDRELNVEDFEEKGFS